jgi:hypothetical protein
MRRVFLAYVRWLICSSIQCRRGYELSFRTVCTCYCTRAVGESSCGCICGVLLRCAFNLQARIYSPSRTAGQQGLGNTFNNKNGRPWKIAFDTQEK